MSAVRHPPGRSGRLWLERRLVAARRGVDLLDRKRRALAAETERWERRRLEARAAWDRSMAETRAWMARTAVLAGEEAAGRAAAAAGPASATVTWGTLMGVAYPARARVELPPAGSSWAAGTSAADQLERAAREALGRALDSAAAEGAYAVLERELVRTRRRQRLLEKRRIPDLERELAAVRERLDEQERDEGVRVRWVGRRVVRDRARS